MTPLDENNFKSWNQQGLIPGPTENQEDFLKRVSYCQNLGQNLVSDVGASLPFNANDRASHDILEEGSKKINRLFGISPNWVPLFFSNYQMTPWHGGCAWIFQLNEETPTAAFLQLRAQFRVQETYLGLYNRSELISHELSHVGRMMYQEPQFEEVLAYQTSSSSWRRWLGPIVQSSKESLFFILILGALIMADLALMSWGHEAAYRWAMWFKLIPLTIIGLALIRLSLRHRQFNHCLKHLELVYGDPQLAREVIYRLRDEEIRLFSKWSANEIIDYMTKKGPTSFRWQFLLHNYPIEAINKETLN